MSRPRVLFCITVYNGRRVVPRAVESAGRLDDSSADIHVLLLDDASPEPGWSEELRGLADAHGVLYYRTPRNLGIPRNVNLGLLTAVKRGYDYVVISNSDVIFPKNLVTELLKACSNPGVGSVTAWSNNVSAYSLPNTDPDRFLADQNVVDWLSALVAGQFSGIAMDVPAGISFCILIPTPVVKAIGLMDPVFGRGYCEETDWSLRSLAAGFRICLAPGTFVYHEGRCSNVEAGVIANHATTVPENEAIIDLRYPQFRHQVSGFLGSGMIQRAQNGAIWRIMEEAARQFGYSIEVGWLPRATSDELYVRAHVLPDNSTEPLVQLMFRGFRDNMGCRDLDVAGALRRRFGRDPIQVNMLDRGGIADRLRGAFDPSIVSELRNYPSRV